MDNNFNVKYNNSNIIVEKLCNNLYGDEKSLNMVGEFDLINNVGYVWRYQFHEPKEYKTINGWKNAIKRLFDIEVK
jgi:hypothetical protein